MERRLHTCLEGRALGRSPVGEPSGRTRDTELDEMMSRRFRPTVKLLDLMRLRPDIIDIVVGFAEDRVMGFKPVAKTVQDKREEPRWNSTHMTVGKIPK